MKEKTEINRWVTTAVFSIATDECLEIKNRSIADCIVMHCILKSILYCCIYYIIRKWLKCLKEVDDTCNMCFFAVVLSYFLIATAWNFEN